MIPITIIYGIQQWNIKYMLKLKATNFPYSHESKTSASILKETRGAPRILLVGDLGRGAMMLQELGGEC